MDDNKMININEADLTSTKNKFSLKDLNEDNLLECDKEKEKINVEKSISFSNTLKYKINYPELIRHIRDERNDKKFNTKNEFYCNILLMPSNIDFSDKVSSFSLITYCYQVSENDKAVYFICNKLEKYKKFFNAVDQNYFLNIYCRAAYFCQKKNNYFYAYKFINICNDLINNNISKISESKKKSIADYIETMKKDLQNYLESKKTKFKDENFMTEEKYNEIKNLINLILSGKNEIDLNDNKNYIYVINKDWLGQLLLFIDPYLVKKKETNFYDEVFDLDNVYKNYFYDKNKKTISSYPYPGPINNFFLNSFKDNWKDNTNLDENDFIKNNLELNKDYFLINEKDWNFFNDIFDSTNVIRRKANNLDLIEMKFLLIDRRIKGEYIPLLKQKYILINKNSTIMQLKNKILNIANYMFKKKININKQDVNFFILNKDKKDLLIEINYAFVFNLPMYESLYIEKIEFQPDNTLSDFYSKFDKNKYVLIFEIIKKDELNYLVQIDHNNDYKCSICGTKIKNLKEKYNCDICHFSLFCSRKCANNSEDHLKIDKNLTKILKKKFILSDLLQLKLSYLLNNGQSVGRIGLSNLGSTCYLNSVIQCLSNTEDLTKYFLQECFNIEINNANCFGSKGDISKAYYKLLKTSWQSYGSGYINTKDFVTTFCGRTKLFLNPDMQQDAHDFLLALLDTLHEDLNRITKKEYKELTEQTEDESDEKASARWWDYQKSREDSIITDLFQGQYKSTINCSCCNKNSVNYDIFRTLSLPIPPKKTQFQIKLFTYDGNYIDLNINEQSEIKDIIFKAINFLNKKNYIEYVKKVDMKDNLFNYNVTEIPDNILYNNIKIIEFNKDYKMINSFDTNYENIGKKNLQEIPFDNKKYIDVMKKKQNSEIVLFEKDTNSNFENYVNVFVYPLIEVQKESMFTMSISMQKKIISYPITFSIKKNETLKNLHILIVQRLQRIMRSQGKGNINVVDILFPHFIEKWEKYKITEGVCPICKKANDKDNVSCYLFNFVEKKMKIFDFIKLQKRDTLILYARSDYYGQKLKLYKGMDLLFDKKSEIDLKQNLTLYDSLDFLNKGEVLDGENMWYCGTCKEKRKAEKKIELYRIPYYLIIQLKRFKQKSSKSPLGNKIETYIEYKEILNLKDFVIGPDKNKAIYELYGVVIHKKSFNTNHYFSYCKSFGDWLSFDDSKVNLLENGNGPINKDAYLLFYKRKDLN